ncbi:hypothetical protein FoTM2_011972 [Fusarium oxysporum f. sp. vasinfectum]|nr:hypothetical protein QWA68_015624 [Fusarium oxysporum]KAK2929108.1 hypothetical protein FoTM2_011972 [Fusarium oxysporum f. sp. vasinfectum]
MKLDRSRAASESLPDYNNAVEFPDNNSDFPGSPVSSIELFQDAPTASSLDLSTESVLMGGALSHYTNTNDTAMTDTETASRQSTASPI